jgi:hypothetical protein
MDAPMKPGTRSAGTGLGRTRIENRSRSTLAAAGIKCYLGMLACLAEP